ncbi:DUF4440 domain-containing protein [Microbaculum marinum]|uniref:DUF4440 domain-containing protein n=1 Tax=Microbaculum marinum TaxID=1764581 RepID=A0AAW9S4N0_9HYPH
MTADRLHDLVALETARTQAWLDRDAAALAALLDDDFLEINYFGRLSKGQILDDLFPRLTLVALAPSDYDLTPVGPDAALLTYVCSETIRIDGSEISGTFTVAALWRQRENRWRLLSWQITPIAGTGA